MKRKLILLLMIFLTLGFYQTAEAQSPLSYSDFVENVSDIKRVKDSNDVMNSLIAKGFTRQGQSFRRVSNGSTIDVYVIYKTKNNTGFAIEFSNPQDALNFDKQCKGYRAEKRTVMSDSYKGWRIDSYYCPPKTGSNARNKNGYVMVQRIKNKVRILCNAKDNR